MTENWSMATLTSDFYGPFHYIGQPRRTLSMSLGSLQLLYMWTVLEIAEHTRHLMSPSRYHVNSLVNQPFSMRKGCATGEGEMSGNFSGFFVKLSWNVGTTN